MTTKDEINILIFDTQRLLDDASKFNSRNLPLTAAGRLQAIQRMLNAQWPPEADSDFTAELPF